MEISVYDQKGKVVGTMSLPEAFFEHTVNEHLIHKALVAQLSNERQPIAHTKTRSERAGSTRKLYRQKGTGQARKGPASSPVLRKGGVAFGPRNDRNFEKYLSKKERRGALLSALSAKANENAIVALEKYEGGISTKSFAVLLKNIGLERKTLLVLPEKMEALQKSSSNIASVKSILVNYLNVRDLLQYKNILFLKSAIEKLPTIFK